MNSKLRDLIDHSNNIVFFGGAGVSTESGIPDFRGTDGLSRCLCGGIIKPDVVLDGENLLTGILDRAFEYIARADMLIVGGTSLAVYPAAGLVNRYHGSKLVLINKEPTPFDNCSRNVFYGSIGTILGD